MTVNRVTKQLVVVSSPSIKATQLTEPVALFAPDGTVLIAPKLMPFQANSAAADIAAMNTNFNALLTKLKNAGLMAAS